MRFCKLSHKNSKLFYEVANLYKSMRYEFVPLNLLVPGVKANRAKTYQKIVRIHKNYPRRQIVASSCEKVPKQ